MEDKVFSIESQPIPVPKPTDANMAIQSMGEITDVSADTEKFIKQKYFKQVLYGGIALAVLDIAWLWYIFLYRGISRRDSAGVLEVALIPFGIAAIAYGFIKNKVEDAFMQQFAAVNGFAFQKIGLPANLDGNLFSIGHSRNGRDLVTGVFQNFPLTLFNYNYTVGSGKSSHTDYYTVFRLDYPEVLPPIFLQLSGQPYNPQYSLEKVSLEGDFNKYFTLYTKKGFETEALEVFTPDFMAKIQDQWNSYSLEFVSSSIYIYYSGTVSKKIELDKIYSLAQFLIEKIGPLAQIMKSDVAAMDSYFDKKS